MRSCIGTTAVHEVVCYFAVDDVGGGSYGMVPRNCCPLCYSKVTVTTKNPVRPMTTSYTTAVGARESSRRNWLSLPTILSLTGASLTGVATPAPQANVRRRQAELHAGGASAPTGGGALLLHNAPGAGVALRKTYRDARGRTSPMTASLFIERRRPAVP